MPHRPPEAGRRKLPKPRADLFGGAGSTAVRAGGGGGPPRPGLGAAPRGPASRSASWQDKREQPEKPEKPEESFLSTAAWEPRCGRTMGLPELVEATRALLQPCSALPEAQRALPASLEVLTLQQGGAAEVVKATVDHLASLPLARKLRRELLLGFLDAADLVPDEGERSTALKIGADAFARTLHSSKELSSVVALLSSDLDSAWHDLTSAGAGAGPRVRPRARLALLRALRARCTSQVPAAFCLSRAEADGELPALRLTNMAWVAFHGGYTLNVWAKVGAACMGTTLFKIGDGTDTFFALELLRCPEPDTWLLSVAGGEAAKVRVRDGEWHLLSVSQTDPFLSKSRVVASVDGAPRLEALLPYPSEAQRVATFVEGFRGRVAFVQLLDGALSPAELALLHGLGPATPDPAQPAFQCALPSSSAPLRIAPLETTKGSAAHALSERHLMALYEPLGARTGNQRRGDGSARYCLGRPLAGRAGRTVLRFEEGPARLGCVRGSSAAERAMLLLGGVSVERAAGAVSDWWQGCGGVRACLLLLHRAVVCCRDAAKAALPDGGELRSAEALPPAARDGCLALVGCCAEALRCLGALLGCPDNLQDMLQSHGYHALGLSLLQLPCRAESCTQDLAEAVAALARTARGHPTCATALCQAALLAPGVWAGAPRGAHAAVLRAAADLLVPRPRLLRRSVSAQQLLDLLKLEVCHQGDAVLGVRDPPGGTRECVGYLMELLVASARGRGGRGWGVGWGWGSGVGGGVGVGVGRPRRGRRRRRRGPRRRGSGVGVGRGPGGVPPWRASSGRRRGASATATRRCSRTRSWTC